MNYDLLVNKDNPLNKDYVPDNLIDINEPTGSKIDKSYVNKLVKEVYIMFKTMQIDALKYGYEIFIDSSYRSYEYQKSVFDSLVKEKGIEYASKYCAIPGTSEHQTGLALDIIIRRNGKMIEDFTDQDDEIIWTMNNSYKYGFILRYPKGKENITGYNYEPWHFRYVGFVLSDYMYKNNLTLEEYHLTKKRSI